MEDFFDTLLGAVVVISLIVGTIARLGKIGPGSAQQQKGQQTPRQTPQPRQTPPRATASKTMLPPRPETVRPAITPTLHDHSNMYAGSLDADDGTEGSDPHDHGFDHDVVMPSEHSAETINRSLREETPAPKPAPRPALRFSPENIASAFVLQEVLKRR